MINYKAKTSTGEIINSALSAFTFPAGEAHTKREERRDLEPVEIAIIQPSPDSIHDDLFQLAMWNSYIKIENADRPPEGPSKRVLVIPYFPGARADRGKPFGLGVYADFIRNLYLNKIIIFDPHSGMTGDELHAGSDNLDIVYSNELLKQSHVRAMLGKYDAVIAPDKGAGLRTYRVSTALETGFYQAEKTRDFETGKLSGFKLDGLPKDGKYLIVDDICDGGGTFLGLADAIGLPPQQLDLYVSHGVFSKDALNTLANRFGQVYTSNSYNPLRNLIPSNDRLPDVFRRLDVINLLLERI